MVLAHQDAAVARDGLEIPLIDFSAFTRSDTDVEARRATGAAVLRGFQRAGFIYLREHGISATDVQKTFAASARFFARPDEQKQALAWTTPRANRGYSAPGREKTTLVEEAADVATIRERDGVDLKESFEIGREGEPGLPNHWPDKFDDEGVVFKQEMLGFWMQCKALASAVMRAIAVGMELDENWFDPFTDAGDNTLRLLHYPAVSPEVFRNKPGTMRAGAHTDYGSITLLFQDQRGGLQVQTLSGSYVDATPIEGTVVVNAGDLLARWANDTIRSTTHRVVEPPVAPQEDTHPPRYSIAYFTNPNFDAFIDAIPKTFDEKVARKYEGVNSGDYLEQRLAATY